MGRGVRRKFAINPLTPMDHSRARRLEPPGVVQELATMSVLARLGPGGGPEDRALRLASAAARLLRAFSTQFEAYRRLRHGGDQFVRVEHVHINEGAQAVIGNVLPHERGRAQLPEKQIRRDDDDEGAAS